MSGTIELTADAFRAEVEVALPQDRDARAAITGKLAEAWSLFQSEVAMVLRPAGPALARKANGKHAGRPKGSKDSRPRKSRKTTQLALGGALDAGAV